MDENITLVIELVHERYFSELPQIESKLTNDVIFEFS